MPGIFIFFGLLTFFGGPGWSWAACPEPSNSEAGTRSGPMRKAFLKSLRSEIGLLGGLYMNDVMGSAPLGLASLEFHLNEDVGLEVALGYTRFSSVLAKPVQDFTGYTLLKEHDARLYLGSLVWYPFYGKFSAFGGRVVPIDFSLKVGLGVTDDRQSRGITSCLGAGLRMYLLPWLSLRFELQDHLYTQEVIGTERWTQNIVLLAGVGVWIPFAP